MKTVIGNSSATLREDEMRQVESIKRVKLQRHDCKICNTDLKDTAIELTMGKVKELVCEKCGKALSQFLDIPVRKI